MGPIAFIEYCFEKTAPKDTYNILPSNKEVTLECSPVHSSYLKVPRK